MTENEIITAINAVAENIERGQTTPPDCASNKVRTALSRLYRAGYCRGREAEKERVQFFCDRCAEMERENHRLKTSIEDVEARADRDAEKNRKAYDTLLNAIVNMRVALHTAENEMKE